MINSLLILFFFKYVKVGIQTSIVERLREVATSQDTRVGLTWAPQGDGAYLFVSTKLRALAEPFIIFKFKHYTMW